jgi:polyisoprenoid-binding protein YceI
LFTISRFEAKSFAQTGLLSLLTALLCSTPAQALVNVWKIDDKTSSITFSVKHLGISSVSGKFLKFSGTVNYDGKDLAASSVEANISSNSIDTKNKSRDEHLKNKDVLAIELFPAMTYVSKKVVPKRDGSFDIIGVLNLHGVEKEVTLAASPLKAPSKDGKMLKTETVATALVNRKDFDVYVDKAIDKGGALVGDQVKVTLNINLVKTE